MRVKIYPIKKGGKTFMTKQINGPLHAEMEKEQELLHYRNKFYSDATDFNDFEDLASDIKNKIN